MPSIKIIDTDLTKPGTSLYENFAVAIPGWVDETKVSAFKSVCDKNNVYECTSLADFEANVGCVSAVKLDRKFAEAVLFETTTPTEDNLWGYKLTTITATNFDRYRYNDYKGVLYVATASAAPKDTDLNVANIFYAEHVDSESGSIIKSYYSVGTKYTVTTGSGASAITTTYDINDADAVFPAESDNVTFVVLKSLGINGADDKGVGYGNQIAYELIKNGYPIIYLGFCPVTNEGETTYSLDEMVKAEYYEPLKDRVSYDFRYILSGFNRSTSETATDDKLSSLYGNIIDVADSRGDCIALVDINETLYEDANVTSYADRIGAAVKGIKAITGGKNTAIFTPAVTYGGLASSDKYNKNTTLPASFHYLVCAAQAKEKGFAEWYAVAGENRGISSYEIASASVDFGDTATTILEPRTNKNDYGLAKAANVIAKFRNTYLLWGNRAANAIGSDLVASNFLNVRQLITTIKKQLYVACRRFTFDPNSDTLWINFCNAIRPTLEKMKANEGIRDYKIVKITTDQKAMFKARIRIVPIEAVEDFDLSITLEDSISGDIAVEEI